MQVTKLQLCLMSNQMLPAAAAKRSGCPIATTLDLIGDRWTLLLIRDIGLFGKHRNKEFQNGAEGIPSNILASRLKTMVSNGLLEKRIYQNHPPRYEYHLTPAGQGLLEVVRSMALWASRHVEGVQAPTVHRSDPPTV